MIVDKNIANLIGCLEYQIGKECYNSSSYDYVTQSYGVPFRYPVHILENGIDSKKYGELSNIPPNQINHINYLFGTNQLYIGKGLINVLSFLEDRYNINFNKLEQQLQKE